ncbi:hypothetical protein [Flavobacterium agrisoli]|uniref:Uncharacterized protein n=1 Tax=Flavobacterium agrisoli TaxID=2793066 RepID=A0A934UJL1_9FLAO|nr:hypothetical protein [Flavobacterium agrisoli]MBK0370081.1 hypothetical protein [Flavobacterium agrisoli]
MRKYFVLGLVLCSSFVLGQETVKDAQLVKTKMDVFTSKTGVLTKFIDYNLPQIKSGFSTVSEARVRKLISGNTSLYFYQIEKQGKYTSVTASIEYVDLVEVINALNSLKGDLDKDIQMNSDYLENKFTTVDGFQIGYYVSKGKASWYLKLEKYGSDNTLFINDIESLDNSLNGAKSKIEELKG